MDDARARAARTAFNLLYRNRTLYWLASTLPFAGQWRVWQRLVLPRLHGRDVLEVGCGIGTLLADMARAGYRCAAIDRSPQMVAATKAELRRRGIAAGEVPVALASVQAIPHPDAAFDTVVSTFPTEYIYDPAALREIARVLRPGGRLIVVLGAALLPTRAVLAPLLWIQRLVYGGLPERIASCAGADILAQRLPLTSAGLRSERACVRGPFWVAYLVTGTRPVGEA